MGARQEKLKNDPDFANQVKAKAMADFQAADANADGLLDWAEFLVFAEAAKKTAEESGDFWPDYTEDMKKAMYDGANKFTAGKEGVSLVDLIMAKRATSKLMKPQ